MDFPQDQAKFERCWSSAAGALSAMKEAVLEAERRSGEAFICKRDEVANAFRDLATEFASRRDKLSKRVDEFIEEDRKRSYERRKVCGG